MLSQELLLSLSGGAIIGFAAFILMLLNGRIAGISGIFSAVLFPGKGDYLWRVIFLTGMVLGGYFTPILFNINFQFELNAPLPIIIIGGFLVGFGASMGSGCTSGHAVCGISRFSPRSIISTLIFITSGICTVTVVRHLV